MRLSKRREEDWQMNEVMNSVNNAIMNNYKKTDNILNDVQDIILHHSSICSIIGLGIDRSRRTDLKKYRMVPLTGQTTGKGRKIKCM